MHILHSFIIVLGYLLEFLFFFSFVLSFYLLVLLRLVNFLDVFILINLLIRELIMIHFISIIDPIIFRFTIIYIQIYYVWIKLILLTMWIILQWWVLLLYLRILLWKGLQKHWHLRTISKLVHFQWRDIRFLFFLCIHSYKIIFKLL